MAMLPKKDRATAIGAQKFGEDRKRTLSFRDVLADRQTHRHRQTRSSQYSATRIGG